MNPMNMAQPEVNLLELLESTFPKKRLEVIEDITQYEFNAWYGCKYNSRLYTASNGTFLFMMVEIDNWKSPSFNLTVKEFIVKKGESLHVPPGFAIGYKALEGQAILNLAVETKYPENLDTYIFDKSRWYYETFM